MTAQYALSEQSIATSEPGNAGAPPFFDVMRTLISQYANSPVIISLLKSIGGAIDWESRFDLFYDLIWNVDTAQGYGLDVWGRIVGVERVLHVATGAFLGFASQTDVQSLGHGIFFRGANATSNFTLSDDAYRRLILAKALANITDGSIPSLNQILINLFPDYGNSFVRDNGDQTMTYVIGATPTPVDLAIIEQSGVLPRPAGVSVSVETV